MKVFIWGKLPKPPAYGDQMRIRGKLYQPPNKKTLGFDYRGYLAIHRIYSLLSVKPDGVELTGKNTATFLARSIFNLKHRWQETITSTEGPSHEAALMRGVLLGDRHLIGKEMRAGFVQTGTVHILAISGLHIGIIAFIIFVLFRAISLPQRVSYILSIILLLLYAFTVGMRPSVVRATAMASCVLLGLFMERDVDVYNSLALSAILILAYNAAQFFDAGFQLSYLAVGAILYIGKRLIPTFTLNPNIWEKVWIYLKTSLLISLSAYLGIAPLVAYQFGLITPIAILANLIVIPLLTILVASGMLFLFFGLLHPLLGLIFYQVPWLCARALMITVSSLANVPLSHFSIAEVPIFWVISCYLLLLIVLNLRRLEKILDYRLIFIKNKIKLK